MTHAVTPHTQPPADRPTNNGTLLAMQHTTPRQLCKSTSDRGWIHRTHTETSAPKGEKEQQTPYESGANTDTLKMINATVLLDRPATH